MGFQYTRKPLSQSNVGLRMPIQVFYRAPSPTKRSHSPHSELPTTLNVRRQKCDYHLKRPSFKLYWDLIENIELTSAALREYDRRSRRHSSFSGSTLVGGQEQLFTGDFKQFARQGGPDLTSLRNVSGVYVAVEHLITL